LLGPPLPPLSCLPFAFSSSPAAMGGGTDQTVRVRFLSGVVHELAGVSMVDDLRRRVAEVLSTYSMHIHGEDVILMDGHLVLRTNVPLRQLELGPELTAVLRGSRAELPRELRALLQPRWSHMRFRVVNEAVRLPTGIELRQWLCARVVAVYRELAEAVDLLRPYCTETSCPCMRAGKHIVYLWAEPNDDQPPRQLSAPAYMAALLRLAHRTVGSPGFAPEEVLPITDDWMNSVRMLLRRFVRVYAHFYLHHAKETEELDVGMNLRLNVWFQHIMWFVREFGLVGNSDFSPIRHVVKYFTDLPVEKRPDVEV